MDILEFERSKYKSHWAYNLEVGDRCLATVRHATDGSKNIINADAIVISNNKPAREINCFVSGMEVVVPYNELKLNPQTPNQ